MATNLPPAGAEDVLYLIDLLGYVFRSYHGISTPLTSPSGEPTSVTLGTITMLQRLLRDQQPRRIAVVMDSTTPTFRHQLDPRYKSNRPPPPEDLRIQIVRSREIIELYRIPVLQQDGFEADDLIASAVRLARSEKLRCVIVSADKDLMQLVGDDVVLWDTVRNIVYGPEEVRAKWGVPPTQIRDLLALMGDTSDNVPGVAHIGPKKGSELLLAHETLEGIYAHLDTIKAKAIRQTLADHKDEAFLSQKLVSLRDDLNVGPSTSAFVQGIPDVEKLRTVFQELNFHRLLASLDPVPPARGSPALLAPMNSRKRAAKVIDTEEVLASFCERARTAPLLALTLFATSTPEEPALIGLGVSIDPSEGFYLPLAHQWGLGATPQIGPSVLQAHLGPVLAADTPAKVGHSMKLVERVLHAQGLTLGAVAFDTELASYLLDPEEDHSLEAVAKREHCELPVLFDQVWNKKTKQRLEEIPLEKMLLLHPIQAATLHDIVDRMRAQIEEAGMLALLTEVEQPLTRVLVAMEEHGVLVDLGTIHAVGNEFDRRLLELEQKAMKAAGHPFNINAPRQLEEILFDELGLPVLKRTKTGRSTDAEVLEALTQHHELPGIILEHRQLAKLKNTYLDALPLLLSRRTHRIHTSLHQTVAATGRLSSSHPNLQNIPVRTEEGRRIRSAFIAPPGYLLVSVDYSQIELRLLAHFSQDPTLLDAFHHGEDIHIRTAAEIFGKPTDQITGEMRRAAKTINFGVIYGMGDTALAKQLGIPREEAARFIDVYFQRYAGVKAYFEQVLKEARTAGSVSTLLGRRRFLQELSSANRAARLQAERIAQNTPIQGTAADILKLAMIDLREPVVAGASMILTVHDELVFEVPEGLAQEAGARIKERMEAVGHRLQLRVPLRADVGMGRTWAEAHG
ncbi:MAG: DNA polymerase I [Myxococcales bacterium]|nr:DNA polymerase I [Polyangiaceae bacterium]MDW8249583.1 DNA polymerase I [Myxococcales bacterium]